jgi:hypothetical protein
MVEVDVVDMQILGAPGAATYAPHSQTLADAADKGACPPLGAEAEEVAAWPLSCNNPHNATWLQCTPTLLSNMQIGMCVLHADSMSKMGIRLKHALLPGKVQIIRRGSIGTVQVSRSQQGTKHAQKQYTRVSCQICDSVGQSR